MSNELKVKGTSGSTVYAIITNAGVQFWNTATPAFESETDGNWASYKVALTEKGTSGYFVGNFPTGITTAGVNPFYVEFRYQAGASAALSDAFLTNGTTWWNGTTLAEVFQATALSATGGVMAGSFAAGLVDGNGFLKVDVADWLGSAAPSAPNTASVTVAGYLSGQAPLQPTTAGRTLLVNSAGGAAVDWSNVQNQTSTVGLTNTMISSAQVVTGTITVGGYASGQAPLQPTIAGRTLLVSTGGGAAIDFSEVLNPTSTVGLSNTTISSSQPVSGTVTVGGYVSGQAPLQPTTAGRTLLVNSTGGAAIDHANVQNPTATVGLTNTTISSAQVAANVTGNLGGNVLGSVAGDVEGKVLGGGSSTITGVGAEVAGNIGVIVDGYAVGQDPATILTHSSSYLAAIAAQVSGGGTGPIAINQNTGGTDNLRYVDSEGNGIANANILIYLSTNWPGNPSQVIANSVTGSDGRWLTPCYVDHGTYVAVFFKVQSDGPDVSIAFTV